jgi:hypothetical protein
MHACHPAVSYLLIGFAGCSVNPEISYGARKLAQTSRLKKKKKISGDEFKYFELEMKGEKSSSSSTAHCHP